MTWLFECNGGKWGSFDAAATAKLEAAFAAEAASINLDTPHGTLQVSLETMQQTNAATGRVRKLRRVENDSGPAVKKQKAADGPAATWQALIGAGQVTLRAGGQTFSLRPNQMVELQRWAEGSPYDTEWLVITDGVPHSFTSQAGEQMKLVVDAPAPAAAQETAQEPAVKSKRRR